MGSTDTHLLAPSRMTDRAGVEPRRTAPAPRFRPDVEGLRGVAVVLVVADHLLGWPTGGFVGVDVFFVISGFVITRGLVREVRDTGSVDVVAFAVRRARRILPAAVLVVVVTVLAAWVLDHRVRATSVTWDGLASMAMVENWHLIRSSADYFGDGSAASPLQHFWSLAVEEQFYVLWPWAVLATVTVVRVATGPHPSATSDVPRRRFDRALLVVLAVATALSFAVACWEAQARANWSYFSFESRAWELGVGALLAVVPLPQGDHGAGSAPRPGPSSRLVGVVGTAGLLAVLTSAVVFGPGLPFPGPAAALPVLGTAALVAAGSAAGGSPAGSFARLAPRVLGGAVLRSLGRWSYVLYLWHLPVWSVAHGLLPSSRLLAPTAAAVATLLLALVTHRFVEQPLRVRVRVRRPATSVTPARRRGPRVAVATASGLVVVLSAAQFVGPARLVGVDQLPAPGPQAVAPFRSPADLRRAVGTAVSDRSWGRTVPALDRVSGAASAARQLASRSCLQDPVAVSARRAVATALARCTFGDHAARHTVVVVGDSIAVSWIPGVVDALPRTGWRVVGIGLQNCPAAVVTTTDTAHRPAFPSACDRGRSAALAAVDALRPELVVASSSSGGFERQLGDRDARARGWERGTRYLAHRVTAAGARLVVLASPPEGPPVSACALRVVGPAVCLSSPSSEWEAKRRAERRAVVGSAAARFIDTGSWFCDQDLRCPAAVRGVVVRADRGHLTSAYATALAPVLRAALAPALQGEPTAPERRAARP